MASTLSASLTGHDGRSALPSISPNACTAASGRRRGASGVASSRSRSTCRADSVPCNCGCAPNLNSPEPASVTARSSGPYWNDTSSSVAADTSALTLLVSRHGSKATALPLASTAPAGRDSVSVPSKRGVAALERQQALGLDGQRPLVGLQAELQPRAVRARPARPKCHSRRGRRR